MLPLNETFEQQRMRFESNMLGFLRAELELANTFIQTMQNDGAEKVARARQKSRKAYDTAVYFLKKDQISGTDRQNIELELDALKGKLEALGETF